MQDGRPVEYASQALTPTEQRYAQIEKEQLANLLRYGKVPHLCLCQTRYN